MRASIRDLNRKAEEKATALLRAARALDFDETRRRFENGRTSLAREDRVSGLVKLCEQLHEKLLARAEQLSQDAPGSDLEEACADLAERWRKAALHVGKQVTSWTFNKYQNDEHFSLDTDALEDILSLSSETRSLPSARPRKRA